MRILKLSDNTYQLSDMDEAFFKSLIPVVQAALPDPILSIKDSLKGLPPRLQEMAMREAIQAKRIPLEITSPLFLEMLQTETVAKDVLLRAFQRYQPSMTLEDCLRVHKQAVIELGDEYVKNLPTTS